MNQNNRPYTSKELREKLAKAKGIKATKQYIGKVILNPLRKTPHPLKSAHLAMNMWDREKVDRYFEEMEQK